MPHQAPGKAWEGQWVLRVLLPLRLSLGAAGSPLGAGVRPHPGVQGQRRSGLCYDRPPSCAQVPSPARERHQRQV